MDFREARISGLPDTLQEQLSKRGLLRSSSRCLQLVEVLECMHQTTASALQIIGCDVRCSPEVSGFLPSPRCAWPRR